MTRPTDIIISTLMWCAIAAYVVAASTFATERRAAITVKNVRITIVDSATVKVVSRQTVARRLAEMNVAGQAAAIDTRAIERHLAALPEVRRASVWTDLDSTLVVRVEQRIPLMRIRSTSGHRFWYTTDGVILPDRGGIAAYVPIVTGYIPFPFGISTSGSYAALIESTYDDFLERFTAIETERRSLSKNLRTTRTELSQTRRSGPKRLWRSARKERFEQEKTVTIARLEIEVKELERSLEVLAASRQALDKKEKYSYQSLDYLLKLANFVKFIDADDFWAAQIVQIDVRKRGATGPENATNAAAGNARDVWCEPELVIVPRAGDHRILLGALDGGEEQRLEKLRRFYLEALWHEGWNRFTAIDIRYKDQIICEE